MKRNIEMTTVLDERELRRKRLEAKIEADLLAAKIKAQKQTEEIKEEETM